MAQVGFICLSQDFSYKFREGMGIKEIEGREGLGEFIKLGWYRGFEVWDRFGSQVWWVLIRLRGYLNWYGIQVLIWYEFWVEESIGRVFQIRLGMWEYLN